MLALEQEDDVDDVVHDIAHLLAIGSPLEHLLLLLQLLLLDYLDERDHLRQNAEDVGVQALQVNDVKQVAKHILDYLKGVSVSTQQQLIYDGIVDLDGRTGTSADCLFSDLRALLRFLRSLMALLMKLLMLWLGSFSASIIKFEE